MLEELNMLDDSFQMRPIGELTEFQKRKEEFDDRYRGQYIGD